MARDYLPDSYLRKRQRDAKLRRARDLVMTTVIVIAAVVSGVVIYTKLILPKQSNPGVTEQMAEQRQELADKQAAGQQQGQVGSLVADAGSSTNKAIPNMADTDLSSLNYTSSFPLINVSVEAGSSGDQRTKADVLSEAEPAETEQPTEQVTEPAAVEKPASAKPEEKPKAETKPQDKPKDDKPAAKADEKKPEAKPAEKKPADEKKPAEEKPAAASGQVLYKVYAGSHASREDAERQVKDLSAVGLSGTVIESQPNFLVFVGSFSSFEDAAALRDKLKGSGFSAFASKTKR